MDRGYFLRARNASDPRAPRPVSTLPVETAPPSARASVDIVPQGRQP